MGSDSGSGQLESMGAEGAEFLLTPDQESDLLSTYGGDADLHPDILEDVLDDPNAHLIASTHNQTISEISPNTSSFSNSFHNHFVGHMDLLADKATVMKYLDAHQGWFRRCAHPFKADPIGETGYAMGVGKVGAMGFQVDARVGLDLLPPDANAVYRITTIPIPDQPPQGYEVDFQAEMRLMEKSLEQPMNGYGVMTSVEWDLHLTVFLQFPQFIQKLSQDILQKTGDAVLGFVVQRVSKSLTAKVQDDFHSTHGIKVPRQLKLRR
ncbi:MAG: DUF1997 domain-containing protein [Pseudanabaenaceae cyanobacterium bins.39]|nr:DUF1997 domain-containing protein [Pseudanabaenaceae cyanobacterium bins.39]